MNLGTQAAKNAQPIITGTFLGNQILAAPPKIEQHAIVTFLDRETAKIDALIAKIREAIERLKELRTALISAAVTGKIDVREEFA
jgi:restriction endonuclease S subunit